MAEKETRPQRPPGEQKGIVTDLAHGIAQGVGTGIGLGAGHAIVGHLTKPKEPDPEPPAPNVILPPRVEGED